MFSFFRKESLYPWMEGASIYKTIRAKIDENGRLLDDKLPDDESFWKGQPIRWVAGGLDGAFGHHAGGKNEVDVKEMLQLLARQSRKPSLKTRRSVYLKLMQADVLSVIDYLLEALRKHPGLNIQNLYNEAYWLAEKGAHRNAVKFGIALLGQFDTEHHRELVLTLGRHDEFTLYAAVAIQNSLSAPNAALFELAQAVEGWGKIQLVERLEPDKQEIKDWLLRKGCQNSVMYEYLAYTCARKGELHTALAVDEVDAALYNGAGDIFSALTHGGPAEDMDDYEHAPAAIGEYLRLSQTMCKEIHQLTVIMDILDWLNQDAERWKERLDKNWTEDMRSRYRATAEKIIAAEGWEEKVREGLRSGDDRLRFFSIQAARALGLTVWQELFEQLRLSPLNGSLYYELMRTDDEQHVRTLVSFAEAELPLQAIASGPADEMGLGPSYEAHGALDFVVQELGRYPGVGRKLIGAALQSPVVRNRNMALKALEAWPLDAWEKPLALAVKRLAEIEPVPDVQERIVELIKQKGI